MESKTDENIKNLLSDLPNPLYLNLGCGNDMRKEFINIDLYSEDENVLNLDVRNLPFPENSVDLILASDIIEHFSHREIDNVLSEWSRVLKENGTLIIRCPSLKLQAKAYLDNIWNADVASYMIFGSQKTSNDFHYNAFDENSIKKHLAKANLFITDFKEFNLPQTQGFINLTMVIKAVKRLDNNQSHLEENAKINLETSTINTIDNIITTDDKINIIYEGRLYDNDISSNINKKICLALVNNNKINLTILSDIPKTQAEDTTGEILLLKNNIRYQNIIPNNTDKTVWISNGDNLDYPNIEHAKWIINYCYNTKIGNKLETFKKADEIWITSSKIKNELINAEINPNKIKQIPIEMNTSIFSPIGNKYKLDTNKTIKVLFISNNNDEIEKVISNYCNTFNKNDNISLIIQSNYKSTNILEILSEKQQDINNPEIIYISNELTEEMRAELARSCNILLCPYINNFSIHSLEAMACGLPIAAIDNLEEIIYETDVLESCIIKSNAEEQGENELNNNVNDYIDNRLSSLLKYIYQNSNEFFIKGIKLSNYIRYKFTLNKTKIKIFSLLDNLLKTNILESDNINTDKSEEENDNVYLKLDQAENLYKQQSLLSAKEIYNTLLENNDLSLKIEIHCLNRITQILLKENNYYIASNYINKIENLQSNNYDYLWNKTIILKQNQQYEEALECISLLINHIDNKNYISTISINYIDCLIQKANILLLDKKYADALKTYTLVLSKNKNTAAAYYGIGICYEKANLPNKAKKMYETAIKYEPKYRDINI